MNTCKAIILASLFVVVAAQNASSYYYGPDGYTQYNNPQDYLAGVEELLSIRFKTCMLHGLLMYATSQDNSQYFVVGVSDSRIVVEFDLGRGLREVLTDNIKCLLHTVTVCCRSLQMMLL